MRAAGAGSAAPALSSAAAASASNASQVEFGSAEPGYPCPIERVPAWSVPRVFTAHTIANIGLRRQEQNMKLSREITAVIPTLNAAATLPATLAALGPLRGNHGRRRRQHRRHGDDRRDAGCADRGLGAGQGSATRGRHRGGDGGVAAAAARRHAADPRLADRGRGAYAPTGRSKAGYFRFLLDSADPRARRLERLVAWRCRVLALPYGDQGLLIHRRPCVSAGGMRPLPLMEDVDLIRRLGRRRLVGLAAGAVTSAAKWERDGWYRRSGRNLLCLSLWLLGVPPARIARIYE